MKPLELTVCGKLEYFGVTFGYETPERHATSEADDMAAVKRFTDTELVAEFHASTMDSRISGDLWRNYPGESHLHYDYMRRIDQEFTIHRFATLPHYDDDQS
jgi:hypothetical protein